ncbi:regulatory protein MerR [Caldalkalibacillus thermarum TA2.A1]|uniref:MerR family transcriptional regulator n=1 Tax=Caldalkalibacillus thermarum (strain TA2.A1) TaxID=986075 RepID=F5L7X1_CALTT|nr:MerR family transcriptional regulator [Caldalkalibacillus thermarum]EGL82559.1 regulatory protein MerR [Caldalkalibacillus thermarum TA2.A1]QZT34791.1 MerR family transcriptional regulator [Caldalkalibacillus thermarum TA2.A1]
MGKAFKTKEVAKRLGVSSRTIQRWVRTFNVPYQTNAQGHYTFEEQHIKLLEKIKDQLKAGVPMEKIELSEKYDRNMETKQSLRPACVTTATANSRLTDQRHTDSAVTLEPFFKEKLAQVQEQVNRLEQTVSTKADEVVYEQLIVHRRELERLTDTVSQLEHKLEELESEVANLKASLQAENEHKPTKRFSFFSLAR